MVKDRLDEFREEVERCGNNEDISISNHFTTIDMEGVFTADILYKVNLLGNLIEKVTELVGIIKQLQNAMLVPLPNMNTKKKLEEKMQETREISSDIRQHLKEMKQMQELVEPITDEHHVRQRIIEVQSNVIIERFCNVMDDYHTSVIAYRETCKTRVVNQLRLTGVEKNDLEIEESLDSGCSYLYPQIITEIHDAKQSLNDMETRHSELLKLEDGIRDLHDMFIDLASQVEAQGIQIISIEEYLLATTNHTKQTNYIIRQAKSLDRSAKRKKTSFIIICAGIVVICIVYFIVAIWRA